jgi:hypothetical protein
MCKAVSLLQTQVALAALSDLRAGESRAAAKLLMELSRGWRVTERSDAR